MSFFIRKIYPLLRYSFFVLLAISTCSCSLSRVVTGLQQPVVQNEAGEASENDTQDSNQEEIAAEDENAGEEDEDTFSDIDDLQQYAERMGISLEDTENNEADVPDLQVYVERIDIPLPKTAYNKPVIKPWADRSDLKFHSKKSGMSLDGTENKDLMTAINEWMGVPYKWGGCGKDGVDCSCFVQAIYRDVYGINLSRTSSSMFNNDLVPADKEDLREGDIISFKMKDNRISHIGIYLKNNKFVHVSRKKGVMISSLSRPYFQKRFYSAGRSVKSPDYNIARKSAQPSVKPTLIARTKKSVKLSDLVIVKSLEQSADKKKLTVSMLTNLPEKFGKLSVK